MRGNGGRIGPKHTPATVSASGVWSLAEAGDYQRQSLWPTMAPPALYAFTNATFTPGGQTGTGGPSLAQALTGLTGTGIDTWKSNTSYFNTSGGIQLWTVPSTGSYTITTEGAGGGNAGSNEGGLGARIIGTVSLTEGHIIRILVGQLGGNWGGYGGSQGGGGGGTFVYNQTTSTLLIAAGGGGGALYSGSRNSDIDANTGTSGKGGWNGSGGSSIGGGGTNGTGGACYLNSGGGGGGFSGNGGTSSYQVGGNNGTGGTSFLNGGQGAIYGNALGGFGGGGGADWVYWTGAGGGGGYSGGGGGYYYGFGGGGGSYNAGTSQTAALASSRTHGSVTITKI
jgi:hypothetical protein